MEQRSTTLRLGSALSGAGKANKFVRDISDSLGKLPPQVLDLEEAVLGALALIDLSLAGNLLVIVIFSGYENFVSKFEVTDHKDRPEWQGTVDFSTLKLKLIASIVAISGIHLLKLFMDVEKVSEKAVMWMVIIHLVFVVSGVLLALMDRIAAGTKMLKK
jgi:uncharacterized protein (TIGR00645 family)